MPPKNMISVARNSHMPSDAAFFCCWTVENWCTSAGLCSSGSMVVAWLSCNGSLQFLRFRNLVVVISFPSHNRSLVKIECRWRRGRLPLEASGAPWIGIGNRAVAERPEQIDHGQQIADREHAGAGGRENVQDLKLRRILPVTAGHADVAENELRKEREVEADENEQRR